MKAGMLCGLVLAAAAAPAPAAAQSLDPAGARPGLVPAPRWRFLPSVALAYDSFGQRYVVADEDTLDLLDEVSGRLVTTLERSGRTSMRLRNTLALGQEATRNDVELWLERRGGAVDLRLEQELRYKAYAEGSDYALSSDYLVDHTRLTASWRFAERWRLRAENRFEAADFAARNRYNYDYLRNDAGAEIERTYGFFSVAGLGYQYGLRSVPDSTVIDYRRHVLRGQWQHDDGQHALWLDQRLERRRYGDMAVRSHFVDWNSRLSLRLGLRPALRLRPEYQATLLRYDRPDSLYSDSSEQSVECLLEGDVSASTVLAVGPRGEFRRTGPGIDRAYNQWGLKGSVLFSLGSRLWLQFTDEVGLRRHLAGDDVLFTDYVFNWSTLYVIYQPRPRLALDLLFSLNPENHAEDADDTTTILVSTSLTYGWR